MREPTKLTEPVLVREMVTLADARLAGEAG